MTDAVALTDYLRDYIWSIGINQMRAASPDGEVPAVLQPSTPAAPAMPALKSGRLEHRAAKAGGGR